jgi:predicted O-methyltransferase YrrM
VSTEPELLDRVRRARRRLVEAGPNEIRSEGDFDRVTLPGSDGDVLRDLVIAEIADVVIEIGLAYGSSALAIGEALVSGGTRGKHHLIIDAYQDHFRDAGWQAVLTAGLGEICSLVPERSQLALPRLVTEGRIADAAFVDGSHIFHNVFVDLFFLRELVRPGGLIILDDCQWPSVATAVRYFQVNARWQPEPIGAPTRLRAYRLPSPTFEPTFDTFEPFGVAPDYASR